jgi:hypothetical protein
VERDSSSRVWSAINHSPTTQTSPGKGAHDQDCRARRYSISICAVSAQQDTGVAQNSSAWDDETHRLLQNLHFLFHGATASSGPGPPHNRDYTIALRHTTLGRTALYEWSAPYRDLHLYLTTHNTHNRQRAMPPARFEPAIPASDRQQAHTLDRATIGFGAVILFSASYGALDKDSIHTYFLMIHFNNIFKLWYVFISQLLQTRTPSNLSFMWSSLHVPYFLPHTTHFSWKNIPQSHPIS